MSLHLAGVGYDMATSNEKMGQPSVYLLKEGIPWFYFRHRMHFLKFAFYYRNFTHIDEYKEQFDELPNTHHLD